jgi:hypothetical protein
MMSRIGIDQYVLVDLKSGYGISLPYIEWLQSKEDNGYCSRAVDEVASVSAGRGSLPLAYPCTIPVTGSVPILEMAVMTACIMG